jgi:hypothetical protein
MMNAVDGMQTPKKNLMCAASTPNNGINTRRKTNRSE